MIRILLRTLNAPILIGFVILGIALQTSLFNAWPASYFQPDTVLWIVIWCSLKRNFEEGACIVLIIAEIAEIHSAAPQGTWMLCYMAVFLILRAISQFTLIPTFFSYTSVTCCAFFLLKISHFLVLNLLGSHINEQHFSFMATTAAVETLAAPWIYRHLHQFDVLTFKNPQADREETSPLNTEGL
jgi:hypothetical protein